MANIRDRVYPNPYQRWSASLYGIAGSAFEFREKRNHYAISLMTLDTGETLPLIFEQPEFVELALIGDSHQGIVDYVSERLHETARQLLCLRGVRKLLTA